MGTGFVGVLLCLRPKVERDDHGEHGQKLIRAHPAGAGQPSEHRRQDQRDHTLDGQQVPQPLIQLFHISHLPSRLQEIMLL